MATFLRRSNGNTLVFDVAETITRTSNSEVTDHPIESGATITDHVISSPREVSVSAIISDAAFSLQTTLGRELESQDPNATNILPFGRGRVAVALSELTEIRDRREVFTLELSDEIYENMVFTSFSMPRDSDTGDALRITFTARQIIQVERSFVEVPSALFDAADQAASESEAGAQQGEEVGDQSVALSVASSALDVIKDVGRIIEQSGT